MQKILVLKILKPSLKVQKALKKFEKSFNDKLIHLNFLTSQIMRYTKESIYK